MGILLQLASQNTQAYRLMARIRTVKPEFWEDEGVGQLTRDQRLLYIATWNLADDEGLLRWTPDYIKAEVFRYDLDMTAAKVAKLMDALVADDFVFPYTTGRTNQRLAFIIRFRKHQRINRPQPSKLPPPSLQNPATKLMYGRRDDMLCHLCNEPIVPVTDLQYDIYATDPNNNGAAQERQKLSIDHVVPISKGGSDYPTNVRACHISCNKSRGNRDLPPDHSVNGSVNGSRSEAVRPHGAFTAGRGIGSGREKEGEKEGEVDSEKESPSSSFPALDTAATDPTQEIAALKEEETRVFRWADLYVDKLGFTDKQFRATENLMRRACVLDDRVLEECLNYLASLENRPKTVRYVETALVDWAAQRGVAMLTAAS